MDERVQKYVAETQQAIDDAKRQERENLLIELGLFEMRREYAPKEFAVDSRTAMAHGYSKWERQATGYVYYREERVLCEVTDEEYEVLLALKAQKEALGLKKTEEKRTPVKVPDEYAVKPDRTGGGSQAASFMRGVTWFIWILGALLAILNAGLLIGRFNFTTFLTTAAIYSITGMVFKCMAELFENIQCIANSLGGMSIKKKE